MNKLNTFTVIPILVLGSIVHGNVQSAYQPTTEYESCNNKQELPTAYNAEISYRELEVPVIHKDIFETDLISNDWLLPNDFEQSLKIEEDLIEYDLDSWYNELIKFVETGDNFYKSEPIYPAYHLINYSTLSNYIDAELSRPHNDLIGSKESFLAQSNRMAEKLSTLDFKDSAFEILPNYKVKFTLLFEEKKSLRITKVLPLNEEVVDNLIFYTYFENKAIVSANTNDLDEFVQGFTEYMAE